jgi:hypothetical protein
MPKQNLLNAREELFRRAPDETFPSLQSLWEHCHGEKKRSADRWRPPQSLTPTPGGERPTLDLGEGASPFRLNDWSFTQLCQLAGASKETVNRLTADTASRVLRETLPRGSRPLQLFTQDDLVRSIHGHGYTRLHNADVVTMLREFAVDFAPPQAGKTGGTGLYCGEQDLFCFLIDPTGWAEIEGEAFAPGFFVWNSEVGRRSVGVSTFWFQAVCANHIVWDAVEVTEVTRKHTGRVGEALADIRRAIEQLVEQRDRRRDGFVEVVGKAMHQSIGEDAEEAMKALVRSGVPRTLGARALDIARTQGRFTVFSLVDALTRLAGELRNAGDRSEADQKAASLLALVN